MKFPWYEIVDKDEPVLQGDFLLSCPVFIPAPNFTLKENEELPFEIAEYDVIVMSQSCDLVLEKIDLVLVCPIWLLSEMEKKNDFFKKREGKETLRQGNIPGYHLLNKCEIENIRRDFVVVDFRNSYARFFMRVGLPIDIPLFK